MLKNLLVHLPSERPLQPVVDCAVSLAARFEAHLDAVAIGYEAASLGLVADGGVAVAATMMEMERDRALQRANAAVATFEPEARRAGIEFSTRALCAIPADAAESIATLARLADLTLALQPERSQVSFDNSIPEEILFYSGGPVLMVPYIHKGAFDPSVVGIAWDGSRLAARAVRDAMPFLTAAKIVTVLTVNEDRDDATEASSKQLVGQLARRGIDTRIERMTADSSNIHNAILSSAADNGIGMLVMGGYGHSRLKEWVLGGVTRGIFESMTIPTLMSH
jgi:nucleotide-binding universal stress UspA family protein